MIATSMEARTPPPSYTPSPLTKRVVRQGLIKVLSCLSFCTVEVRVQASVPTQCLEMKSYSVYIKSVNVLTYGISRP